jgi:hypothetical protein
MKIFESSKLKKVHKLVAVHNSYIQCPPAVAKHVPKIPLKTHQRGNTQPWVYWLQQQW